jgi:hypothetical protein
MLLNCAPGRIRTCAHGSGVRCRVALNSGNMLAEILSGRVWGAARQRSTAKAFGVSSYAHDRHPAFGEARSATVDMDATLSPRWPSRAVSNRVNYADPTAGRRPAMPMSGWVLHSDPASAGCRPGPRRCAPVSPCPWACSWQPTRAPPRGPAPVSAPRRRRVESQPPRLEEAWSEYLGVFVVGAVLGTAPGAGPVVPRP